MTQKRSWLEGPQLPGQNEDPNKLSSYAGEAIGLPKDGLGSLSTLMPRMIALLIDWFLSMGIAFFITTQTTKFGGLSTLTMLVFVLMRLLTVWLLAQTPGHAVMGIGVARLDDATQRVGLWRSFVRILLTIFMFPPVVQDTDGRGLHDRVTQTGVIKTR